MQRYRYKKPLSFKNMMAGGALETTDVGYSISQHIELLIFTHLGEHRFDKAYGCAIWEYDFELIVSDWKWEQKLKESLLSAIQMAERRIYEVDLQVALSEVERALFEKDVTEVKKRITIHVTGRVVETGEAYHFSTEVFLGPMTGSEGRIL